MPEHPLRSFLLVCREIREHPATADFALLKNLFQELSTAQLPDGVSFREVMDHAEDLYSATRRVVLSWEQENAKERPERPFPRRLFGPASLEVERANAEATAALLSTLANRLEPVGIDLRNYMLASECCAELDLTLKQLDKLLAEVSWVDHFSRGRRHYVHRGDWAKLRKQVENAASQAAEKARQRMDAEKERQAKEQRRKTIMDWDK
jgi:hypothetical protein